ncbi:MAG: tetratricopeptide repeat protein [Legionella sp.]|jgi:tetratricopeptide (TPR) repeat protein
MANEYHNYGVVAYQANDYYKAKEFFVRAVVSKPDNIDSHFYLAKVHYFLHEPVQAIASLRICIRDGSSKPYENLANVYDLMGQCYILLNQSEKAINFFKKAMLLDGFCISAWHNAGLAYLKLAKNSNDDLSAPIFENARLCLNKALDLSPDNPMMLNSMADWHESYGLQLDQAETVVFNLKTAIDLYQKAISKAKEAKDTALITLITENLADCVAEYGHHLYKNNDFEQAMTKYAEVLKLDAEHAAALTQMGMCYFKQNNYDEARKYFIQLLETPADFQASADAWLNIACTYRMQKNWEEADVALKRAKDFAADDESIAEEEIKLVAARLNALQAHSTQTLFGASAVVVKDAEDDEEKRNMYSVI